MPTNQHGNNETTNATDGRDYKTEHESSNSFDREEVSHPHREQNHFERDPGIPRSAEVLTSTSTPLLVSTTKVDATAAAFFMRKGFLRLGEHPQWLTVTFFQYRKVPAIQREHRLDRFAFRKVQQTRVGQINFLIIIATQYLMNRL